MGIFKSEKISYTLELTWVQEKHLREFIERFRTELQNSDARSLRPRLFLNQISIVATSVSMSLGYPLVVEEKSKGNLRLLLIGRKTIRAQRQLVGWVKQNLSGLKAPFELQYGNDSCARAVKPVRFYKNGMLGLTPHGYRNFRFDRMYAIKPVRYEDLGARVRLRIECFNKQVTVTPEFLA